MNEIIFSLIKSAHSRRGTTYEVRLFQHPDKFYYIIEKIFEGQVTNVLIRRHRKGAFELFANWARFCEEMNRESIEACIAEYGM